jgi:hypothetical protein
MSRANGRKRRTGEHVPEEKRDSYDPGPGSGEGNAIGESELTDPSGSPIPGGLRHVVNYETVQQYVPSPVQAPAYDGMMAHGVPAEPRSENMQRAAERGTSRSNVQVLPAKPAPPLYDPISVYVVEEPGKGKVLRSAHPNKVTVPNNASDALLLCSRNPGRVRIALLNEDGTTDIRFAHSPAELSNGAGALLVHGQTSYLWLETQERLYAVTTSSTLSVSLSVIEEYEQMVLWAASRPRTTGARNPVPSASREPSS